MLCRPPSPVDEVQECTYKLGRQLGEGSFGAVYRAFPVEAGTGPAVAVKLLKADGGNHEMREVASLRAVQARGSHPNIVRFLGHVARDDLRRVLSVDDESPWSHAIILELGFHSLHAELMRVGGQVPHKRGAAAVLARTLERLLLTRASAPHTRARQLCRGGAACLGRTCE